ncbi:hypothetical protein EON63_14860 [archaeon]|nr:MAG: hypothetical protein EON63_14860 [archaeon]
MEAGLPQHEHCAHHASASVGGPAAALQQHERQEPAHRSHQRAVSMYRFGYGYGYWYGFMDMGMKARLLCLDGCI